MSEEENVDEITNTQEDKEINNKETVQTVEPKKIEADFKTEDFIVTDFEDDNVTEGFDSHGRRRTSSEEKLHKTINGEVDHEKAQPVKGKAIQDADELKSDFFEKVVDVDAEKKKVITEITGMTTEPEETGEKLQPSASVRFAEETPMETISKRSSESVNTIEEKMTTESRMRSKSIDTAALIGSSINISSPEEQNKMMQSMDTKRKSRKSSDNFAPRIMTVSAEDIYESFDMSRDTHEIFFGDIPEEEEEEIVEEEEKRSILDRTPFYEKHDKLVAEIAMAKIKNYILHKKLSMYFKKKKMDDVTKEADVSYDNVSKYFLKLEAYGKLIELVKDQKTTISGELELTRKEKEQKAKELDELFIKMQSREGDVGYGLIYSKTGNAIPEKHVERLLSRQSKQMNQVSSMRLNYIKLKGMVQEKLDAMDALDEIAPGLLLADYEQLKIDNRSQADKIEEKDEELTRLRVKCANSIQVLAHLREKSAALDNDLADLTWDRSNIEREYQEARTRLNILKQSRDFYRNGISKLRDSSGLLTQPTLLRDMEHAIKSVEKESQHLQHIKDEYRKRAKNIKVIRKKIENVVEMRKHSFKRSTMRLRSNVKVRSSLANIKPMLYKSRPTLYIPTIDNSVFDELKTLPPKVTFYRSGKNTYITKRKGG
ncbi:uncharacterized protein LOC143197897 isoform X1 [Rhynchophorus ferrugineus]|uniref:uncharacterized protein LOC143197897 isoform X1 n=2 Tax=Rhynchophorus ferrugineus TaxID=354439 RepID=UPI003FCD7D79